MPEPLDDTDKHGLSTLARRWTPKGMVREVSSQRLMESKADAIASVLNIIIDAEKYLPIIWNPSRCLDIDLFRVLQLNGIDADTLLIAADKARRLAILGPDLRAYRGSFRSHRAVAGALTGGTPVIRTYLLQRAIIDETDFDLILLDDDDKSTTQIFVLGQGPQGTAYIEGELSMKLDELAKPVLDGIDIIPCFSLVEWRDGISGWESTGDPVLVESSVPGEYESVEIGPAVDPLVGIQTLESPTQMPELDPLEDAVWVTVWFENTNPDLTEYWEICAYSNSDGSRSVSMRIYPGKIAFYENDDPNPPALIGEAPLPHIVGTTGPYQRADFQVVIYVGASYRCRGYMNMDPSPWFGRAGDPPSAAEVGLTVRLDTSSTYTSGRVAIAAITASKTEEL